MKFIIIVWGGDDFMAGVIIRKLEAKPRRMFRDGQVMTVMTSAFVGMTEGSLAQLGIGLVDEKGEAEFWSLLCPHCLITAWRGMHILDRTTHIQHATICACYYMGQREDGGDAKRYLDELRGQLPNIGELRQELLGRRIDDNELDEMLVICNDPSNGIDVSTRELESELAAGVINQTAGVALTFEIADAERKAQERDEELSKQPLPNDKSFRSLCEAAGILYPCSVPIGAYGWDWGHTSLERIDEEIVYSGLRFDHCEMIFCTENSKDAKDFGQLGHPVLRLNDGRELILLAVHFRDADMWASLHHVGAATDPEEWRLSELRALAPQMVGITFSEHDVVSVEDMRRGYVAVRK